MSTTTTSAAASSTDADPGDSILTAGGSTLILAFLAIGLFLGGLLVMFSMRRYMRSNGRRFRTPQSQVNPWDWQGYAPPGAAYMAIGMQVTPRRKDIGRKPELWDFRVEKAASDKWKDIMVCLSNVILSCITC